MQKGDLVYDEYYGTCLVREMNESWAIIYVLDLKDSSPHRERVSIETLEMMEVVSAKR